MFNECVKTGVLFKDDSTGEICTGDLFFNYQDGWFVKGIPEGTEDVRLTPDVSFLIVEKGRRPKGPFSDSQTELEMTACSETFREHCKNWGYDYLLDRLPVSAAV